MKGSRADAVADDERERWRARRADIRPKGFLPPSPSSTLMRPFRVLGLLIACFDRWQMLRWDIWTGSTTYAWMVNYEA